MKALKNVMQFLLYLNYIGLRIVSQISGLYEKVKGSWGLMIRLRRKCVCF